MKDKPATFKDLSSYLFWDVDPIQLDWQDHARFIIGRVLDYGTLADWQMIRSSYGLQRIAEEARCLRGLSKRSASFVAALAHVPREEFACYSMTPSTHQHWIS